MRSAADEMIQPSVYGQAIIILVYVPLLTFSGVEGKMFEPMALTVIIALAAAFVLSITFVPAMIAIAVTGRVRERENAAVRGLETHLRAVAQAGDRVAAAGDRRSPSFCSDRRILLFTGLGQEFIPTLDEKNIAMHAVRIPEHGLSNRKRCNSRWKSPSASFPRWPLSSPRPERPKSPPIRCRPMHPIPSSFSSRRRTGRIRDCPRKR